MSPALHRTKELFERWTGRHLVRKDDFPYLTAEKRFLKVRLDLHNKCNIRCRMCYFALDEVWTQPRVDMSDKVIDRMESGIWPRTHRLALSCATEPLISRKLGPVLTRAKRAGVPFVQIITNGLALTESKSAMLIEGGLDCLSLSFDGATASTYEHIRAGSDYERVLANVRRFQDLKREIGSEKPQLIVTAVMMLENMAEWADLAHLAADLGAEEFRLLPQTYYTEFGQDDLLADHRAEVNEALEKARTAANARRIAFGAPAGFNLNAAVAELGMDPEQRACGHCYLPWMQLIVYPSGEVTPCAPMFGHQSFGNLERSTFDEIFYGEAFSRLRESIRTRRYTETCAHCPAGHLYDLNDEAAFEARTIFAAVGSENSGA